MMRVVRVMVLVAVWLILWSDVSAANVVSGLVVAVGIVALFPPWREGSFVVRPLHAAHFVGHFAYKLIQSSVTMTRTILDPRDRTRSGIVAVPIMECSDAMITLIADAVSLTPGTLTVEVTREPPTLFVHALDARDVEQVHREVRSLQVLAIKAFGDRRAIAMLAEDAADRATE